MLTGELLRLLAIGCDWQSPRSAWDENENEERIS
jgi:hypothetical protein